MLVSVTINGGPLDGTHEIESSDYVEQLNNPTAVGLMYSLFAKAGVGAIQRAASPQKTDAIHRDVRSAWGIHQYKLIEKSQSHMKIQHLGPVAPGQPWPTRNRPDSSTD